MFAGPVSSCNPEVARISNPSNGSEAEYLISHGKNGGFGRFAAALALSLKRGDRVVIQTVRGLELGTVLCAATARHLQLLAHTPVGQIIRPVTPADDYDWHRLQNSGPLICADGRRWAADSNLRLELLDIEILLDGSTAVIQFLGEAANREAELAEFLHRKHGLKILLENLSVPVPPDEHAHAGCGKPDCGREAGGCTSCSTGGGCSSCGAGKVDMRAYFAHLRDKMDERPRTSLL